MLTITAPKDTLRHQLARPLTAYRDLSGVLCYETAERVNAFMKKDKASGTRPEEVALWFYMMNHAVAEVRTRKGMDEPLGDLKFILDEYHAGTASEAMRLFYYLLLICTRESRHVKNSGTDFWNTVKKNFGPEVATFNSLIRGTGSSSAATAFRTSPPAVTLGQYVDSLQYIFYNGNFGGGYGGPAWGAVTDCLVEFVHGRFSPELMLDTGWTLAHNNGPIFNKGMLYGSYGSKLTMILDVQRAGMIPQMIAENSLVSEYITPKTFKMRETVSDVLGDESFKGYVDWYLVEALGAVGSYSSQKNAQVAKYGESEAWQAIVSQKQAEVAAKSAAKQKAYFVVGKIGGNLIEVKKVKMERADG